MGKKLLWQDTHYVTCYELLRSGYSIKQMCEVIGISRDTYKKWKQENSAFREAIQKGKSFQRKGKDGTGTFLEYVYERLPAELQEVYDEIERCEEGGLDALDRIDALLQKNGRVGRQHLFLHALVKYDFNLTSACRSVRISVDRLRKWIDKDEQFGRLIKEMEFHKKNFFESALVRLVKDGNPAAVLFANRTLNRDRGYSETQQIDVNVSGTINHNVIDVDALDLPIEVRKIILEKHRERQAALRQEENRRVIDVTPSSVKVLTHQKV